MDTIRRPHDKDHPNEEDDANPKLGQEVFGFNDDQKNMGMLILIVGGACFLLLFNLLLIFIFYRKWKKRLIRCRSEFLTRGRSEYLNRYKPQPVAKSNHFDQFSDWFQKKLRSSFRIRTMQKYSLKRRRKRPDQPLVQKESVGSCEYSVVQKSLLRSNTPHESLINKRVRSGRVRTKNLDTDKDTNIDAKTGDRQNERTMSNTATSEQRSNREDQQASGPEINTLSTLFETHFQDVVNTLSRLEQSTNEKKQKRELINNFPRV